MYEEALKSIIALSASSLDAYILFSIRVICLITFSNMSDQDNFSNHDFFVDILYLYLEISRRKLIKYIHIKKEKHFVEINFFVSQSVTKILYKNIRTNKKK
jgi:hypothetical protein